MKILNRLKAGRQAQMLKGAAKLKPEALSAAKDELVGMGPAGLETLFECLSHGEARAHVQEVLARILSEETLGYFIEALKSPNPATVSGVTQVLSKNPKYDASRLVALLSDPSLNKVVIESILWAQVETLSPRQLVSLVPEVSKDARAVVFRLLEKVADAGTVNHIIELSPMRLVDPAIGGPHHRRVRRPQRGEALMRLTHDPPQRACACGRWLPSPAARSRLHPALADRLRDDDLMVRTRPSVPWFGRRLRDPHLLTVLKDESEYAPGRGRVLNQATTEAIYDS
jgi:HEAT repeat protein